MEQFSSAPFAFGGNVFGWTVNEALAFRLLDQFTDAGFHLIDTADMYSTWTGQPGISETIIGRWLKKSGKRAKVLIATKVGLEITPGESGLSRAHILRSVEGSLRRLQTEQIDLYQAHRDDPGTPLEETLETLHELVKAGKVRFLGASNYSGARLRAALGISEKNNWAKFSTLQPLYNLYDREPFESDLAPVCQKNGVKVLPYYSLAAGFLTGKYRSAKDFTLGPRGPGMERYLNARGEKILAALDQAAVEEGVSPAQISFAWLAAQAPISAPIASATSAEQLNELIAAARITLSPTTLAALSVASKI